MKNNVKNNMKNNMKIIHFKCILLSGKWNKKRKEEKQYNHVNDDVKSLFSKKSLNFKDEQKVDATNTKDWWFEGEQKEKNMNMEYTNKNIKKFK